MLSTVNQTINLSAGSVIDDKVVLLMSANIRTGESPAISQVYKDMEAYKANKSQVDEDFADFEQKVFDASGQA